MVGEEPISLEALLKAKHEYRHNVGYLPDELRLSHHAFSELTNDFDNRMTHFDPAYATFAGLKVELCRDYGFDEWRLGRSREYFYDR